MCVRGVAGVRGMERHRRTGNVFPKFLVSVLAILRHPGHAIHLVATAEHRLGSVTSL